MLIAAHQPHYLPWLGYFDKIRKADVFVLLDHVQFERRNYQNRTRIKMDRDLLWLTVPVRQVSRDERILDKRIDNEPEGKMTWGRRTFLTLEHAYRRARHFNDYAGPLGQVFEKPWERLVDLNLGLLEFCLNALDIRTRIIRSSELAVDGRKSDMILNVCKAVGGDGYLAGMGGSRDYLDAAAFGKAGVRIEWQDFRHPVYPQHPPNGEPVHGLSVLDLLFNCGPKSPEILRTEACLPKAVSE